MLLFYCLDAKFAKKTTVNCSSGIIRFVSTQNRFLIESPMSLEKTDEERLNFFDIDADAGIYGLSEYAAEIFQHLREAEASRISSMALRVIDVQGWPKVI